MSNITCPKCGSQLPDNVRFCNVCGCPVQGVSLEKNSTPASPFDNGAGHPRTGTSLLGSDPFPDDSEQPDSSPFGGMSGAQPNPQPFGGMSGAQPDSSPFGGMNGAQSNSSPFGGMNGAQPNPSPYGGMSGAQPNPQPFGGMSGAQPNPQPFGGMNGAQPNPSPYGGMSGAQPNPQPYGGMSGAQPNPSPYGGMNGAQPNPQPYGGTGAVPPYSGKTKQKKSSKKKGLIIAAIVISSIILLAVAGALVIIFLTPGMKYDDALKSLENQQYDEAYEAFVELDDYKDSREMAQEALYQKGLSLAASEEYRDAMDVFDRIKDYRDSSDQYQDAYYHYGIQLYSDQLYESAIDVFEKMENYELSQNYLMASKYGYVNQNLDNRNSTTYTYLTELKAVDYEDSKSIYKDLYAWKIVNVYFNTDPEDTNAMDSISKYDPVYCHFEIAGGTPDATTYLYCKTKFPDGSYSAKGKSNSEVYDGTVYWWGWTEGIYDYPDYGETGTMVLTFYDDANNKIGKASIEITD